MQPESYRSCVRCVMDTSDRQISFDREGFCNHCVDFLSVASACEYRGLRSESALERLFEDIRHSGKGKVYDCLIGVSGGLDSSYLAYLVKENGLRPLAVHMDNGWDSAEAVLNIRNIVNKLGIDYESRVLDWEQFKSLQLAFLKASVPEAETPTDIAIPAALHKIAEQNGIRHILSAGNLATEGILPKSWHYNAKDVKYFDHIRKTFGGVRLKNFETFDFKREFFFKFAKGIRIDYPLNFVPFSQQQAVDLLREKFDYRYAGRKHYESRYTRFIQSYYLFEKFGIDYRRATLSSQILTGDTTREDAVEQLKVLPYNDDQVEDDKEYIAKKLGISQDEMEAIIALPPKWYWDYPNDDARLRLIYAIYRKVFRK